MLPSGDESYYSRTFELIRIPWSVHLQRSAVDNQADVATLTRAPSTNQTSTVG